MVICMAVVCVVVRCSRPHFLVFCPFCILEEFVHFKLFYLDYYTVFEKTLGEFQI